SAAYCDGTSPGAFASFRRITASTGNAFGRVTWGYSSGTFITDIVVNPVTHHYIETWAGADAHANYAELDQNGNLLATGPVGFGAVDGMGLSYNDASGSILFVSMGNSAEVLGAELNGSGVPMSSATPLTNGGGTRGSFYPRDTQRTGSST